jgi:hypothetical protein
MPEAAETSGMARRRRAEEIEQLLEQYRASGLTQIEYCRQTGVVLSTLGRYLRRHSRAKQQLVRVKLRSGAGPAASFALVLGNGRRIECGWGFGEGELSRLIRVAESA